ncbi:hypothetical protein ACHAXA_008258 [Cyclostephanos tholiformis]|uniref:DNA replication complex GINS protein PSF2 N-terminal domain-containing protein n=1 Tax=Cyclostephanos tholiformis TaxID=382380 RepID=A0ABD3RBT7_9STRA
MAAATTSGGNAPSGGGGGGSGTNGASGFLPPTISFFGNAGLSTSRALASSSFLAGDESIVIIPSFSLPVPLELTSGSYGPFRAGMDAIVPLWLATMLRRRKLARIVPPNWMDVDVLREVLRFERDRGEASFSPLLPYRHAEISRAILSATGSAGSSLGDGGDGGREVPNADMIRLLLEDIAAVRMDKIRRNVHQLSSSTLGTRGPTEIVIDVTNIGSLEMHAIKPFVLESFRLHRELSGKGSSYSRDVESDINASGNGNTNNSSSSTSSGGASGRNSATTTTTTNIRGGGRLRQSRLRATREGSEDADEKGGGDDIGEGEDELADEGELMEPRPLEEIEDDDNEGGMMAEERGIDAGRSRLRRHR